MTTDKKESAKKLTSRVLKTKVKAAHKKKASSQRWMQRHLNDPYVVEAQKKGYRSRAAFKLLQLDEKTHILKPGKLIIDLGCAPGGWTQIASLKGAKVVGIDLLPMEPIKGATIYQGDFTDPFLQKQIIDSCARKVDVILSDMAPDTTGHKQTDHLRIMALLEKVVAFAMNMLAPGGSLIMKTFQGGTEEALLKDIKRYFEKVKHVKPAASRKESNEIYLVALNFKGALED